MTADEQGPGTATCGRHPFDCSVEKHAEEWRDEALRLRAAVANLTAEVENWKANEANEAAYAQEQRHRAEAAEAAVVTARRDAWDEGARWSAGRSGYSSKIADRENPYRARASTQTLAAPAEGSRTPPGDGSHLREQGPTGRREPTVSAVESPAQPPATHCPCLINNTPCDCWYDTECTCTPLSQAMCPVHGNVTETVIAEFGRGADVPTTEPPAGGSTFGMQGDLRPDVPCPLPPGHDGWETCPKLHQPSAGTSPTTPEEPAELIHLVSRQPGPVPTICGAEGATAETLQDVTCRHCWALVGHVQRDEPQGAQSTRDPHCGLTHEHSPTDRCGGTA